MRPAPARQRFTLRPEAPRLARARRRVRDYLTLYCSDRRIVDEMVVCVGEAVTNAVCHSGSGEEIEITLGFRGNDLEVLVRDRGRGFDTAAFDPTAVPDPLSEGGRGLFLISRLSDEVELRCDCGLEVRLLKRAALAVPVPLDELDRILAATLGDTIAKRRHQKAERDELRAALGASDSRFRTLFEGMAEGVALHELVEREGRAVDYRILHFNPAFTRLTGLDFDRVDGRLAGEIYGTAAPFLERYEEVATSGVPHIFEAYFAPTKRHVRITAVSLSPRRFVTFTEDVTALRQATEELRRADEELRRSKEGQRRLLEESRALTEKLRAQSGELGARAALADALNAVARLAGSTFDGETIMQGMLDEGVRALAADAGAIELLDEPDWVVRCQRGLAAADVGRRLSRNEAPSATRAASYREPFATADLQAAASDAGLASAHGLRSVLAVPLLAHEAVSGCLLFYGKGVRVFADAEIDFARTLGAIVSPAVENAGLGGAGPRGAAHRAPSEHGRLENT